MAVKVPAHVEMGSDGLQTDTSYSRRLLDLWSDMGSTVSESVDYVVELPGVAWDGAKNAVTSTIKDAVSGVTETASDAFSWLGSKVLIGVGIALLVLVILARTGVIPQVADLMRSFTGM